MTSVKEWLDKGNAFFDQKKYEESIDAYKRGLVIEPKHVDLLIKVGLSYRYLEKYDDAMDYYNRALEADPKNVVAWNNLGYVFQCKNDIKKAIEMYQQSLSLDPAYELPLINITKLYSEQNEPAKSIEVYKKALEYEPVNAANWIDLGLTYRQISEDDKAIDAYQHALKIEPDNKIAWNNLAWAYHIKKDYTKSITAYMESLKLDPSYSYPLKNVNVLYYELLDSKFADARGWYELAKVFKRIQKFPRALDACNRSLEIKPDFEDAIKLQKKIVAKKERIRDEPLLNSIIVQALELFSKTAKTISISEVISYINFKMRKSRFKELEIKIKILETIKEKNINAKLDLDNLIFEKAI